MWIPTAMTMRSLNGHRRGALPVFALVGSLLASGTCFADNPWGNSRNAWGSSRNAWGSASNAWGSNPNAWGTAPSAKAGQRGRNAGGGKTGNNGGITRTIPDPIVGNRSMLPLSAQYQVPDALQIASARKYRPKLRRPVTARGSDNK